MELYLKKEKNNFHGWWHLINMSTLFVWLLEFALSNLLEMLGLLKSPKAKKLFTYKLQIFADMPQKKALSEEKHNLPAQSKCFLVVVGKMAGVVGSIG